MNCNHSRITRWLAWTAVLAVAAAAPANFLGQGKAARDVPVVSTLNDPGFVTPDPGSN
jgi:hypothetical protein